MGGILFASMIALALSGCAPQATPPTNPTPTPKATSSSLRLQFDEANERYESCMLEYGWASQEHEDGGLMFGYPVGQDQAFAESEAACMKEARIDEVLAAAPPRDELLIKGHQAVVNMWACLVENGWDIPAAPSLQTYLESDGAFTPYEYVPLADFEAAEKVCPQNGF